MSLKTSDVDNVELKGEIRQRKGRNTKANQDSQRATITENMVPYRKFAENQSIHDETSDCDQYKSGDEKSASSKGSPKEDTRRFNVSSKADLVNLIYKDSPSANRVADDSDEDWSAGFPINDNSPLLTNDAIPLQKHKSQRFSRKDYENDDDDDDDDEYSVGLKPGKNESESLLGTSIQVFIPFLIAGFGTVGAGLVLDVVQHWDVFKNITEVFILVPALLGLKGNLEMTLASRLSTQANLGNMNSAIEQWRMASGNIALIQCQAAVVGFLAALFAIIMDWLPEGEFNLSHSLLLCASSLLTASIASFLLGILMVFVIICSRKCNINPDNIATPIAASLGDLTTLALLAFISNLLYYTIDTSIWLSVVLILIFLLLIPVWCIIAARNKYTRDVLYTGWTPVIAAMAISSLGGCILDFAVSRFKGVAVFQPVINGVGGNLVAVQSSRISTYLHRTTKLGTLPRDDNVLCLSPCSAFFRNSIHAKTAVILLMMVVPGHLVFSYGIKLLQAGHTSITFTFLLVYLSAALLQVFILLYLAHVMIFWMWTRKIDPDNSAIPYLTAIGDLLGTGLLALAFLFLFNIGDKDADVGD